MKKATTVRVLAKKRPPESRRGTSRRLGVKAVLGIHLASQNQGQQEKSGQSIARLWLGWGSRYRQRSGDIQERAARFIFCAPGLPNNVTKRGIPSGQASVAGPQDTINLPSGQKRTVTVCNLFSIERKRIDEIARLLKAAWCLVVYKEGLEDVFQSLRIQSATVIADSKHNVTSQVIQLRFAGHSAVD